VTGYLSAMRRSELAPRVCLVGPSTGSMQDQLSFVLESNPAPTAIFAASNLVAGALLRELQRRAITIPEQIAVICFDDFDAATLIRPKITVVRQPTVEIGRQAALLLLQRLSSTIERESRHIVLPTELVIRESCGCPALP
jgi:LacI family transcriptional regulator